MTRLLHTADLHLASEHPERWEALDAVVELAADREVDGLLVAGDLLDAARGSALHRSRVKEAFQRAGCPVFLIPGNHDRRAFEPGQDWGSRTRVFRTGPAETSDELGDVSVTGVPFPAEPVTLTRILPEVRDALEGRPRRVVLIHGTLVEASDPRILSESQEDEGGRYFPCHLEDLDALDAEYVALGHYHQPELRSVGSGYVGYSGSPSPVGSHAWGPRQVIHVELGDHGVSAETLRLPVPYRDRHEHWIDPFEEARCLALLDEELGERADTRCALRVTVTGILAELSEIELRERIQELQSAHAASYRELSVRAEGVGLDPELAELFADFRHRLEELPEDAEAFEEVSGERSPAAGSLSRESVRGRALQLAARALKRAV